MKVVAINGSPHRDEGNTALILNPFLRGMEEAGAEINVFYTDKLNIEICRGDYHCWFKEPGKCFLGDDMDKLLPEIAGAQILVLATPVYVDGMTGPLKNLLDRIIPIGHPIMELREGHSRHSDRLGLRNGKIVLVSNCGFWERDNFDPLLLHVRAIGKNLGREFAGALLRPHGPALRGMMKQGMPVDDVLGAAREAGRQLVTDGHMSTDTLNIVSRELLTRQEYVDTANRKIQEILATLGT
jgi:FMN-dependent NADH-azoreductase